ncbi:unnamed protein product [Mytilus coruscus]|uniref:Tyr recombinase domain-containing protein n=1 Tax=Mytilus coruscus TaxID=42192 RepID=A0A6J8BZ01_MYTCO|nr:unnamed protein product [Mytilus coruscus]
MSGTSVCEEKLISDASGGQLVFKSGPAKPKLESISLCQWSSANLSIMYKLLSSGDLSQTQLLYYLSYTARVYNLVATCDMVSVFFFDREYRRLQKQHKFRWSTDVPHLHSIYLRPKSYSKPQTTSAKPQAAGTRPGVKHEVTYASHSPGGREICKKFNSRKGCLMTNCSAIPLYEWQSKKHVGMVKPTRDLILSSWSKELHNDFDKDFFLHGIEFGFDIVDSSDIPSNIQAKNHPSANPSGPLYVKAHDQVLTEIENNNYIFADATPKIISPMGLIPKPGGGVRLIHDCSRPIGFAVNEFAGEPTKQIFQTLDDATKLVTPNCYMAKVDLKSAYRSVRISKASQQVTGFRWTFPNGFAINWSKVVDPTQCITFLGVEIDSTTMEVRLPGDKLADLKAELYAFTQRSHASKKQLQSLAGKLNWASAVVRGGRVFLRRIINCIMRMKRDWHKARLKGDIVQDILWWHGFISSFNGKSLILDQYPVTSVATDACLAGAGGLFDNDWFYVNWQCDFPFAKDLHINELEALTVVLAARRWAKEWQNKRVLIFCDNATTSNLLTLSATGFDPDRHLSRQNVIFQLDGVLLRISKSKTIQFAERHLDIPLPIIKNSPLCPAQALLLNFKLVPAIKTPSPAFLYCIGKETVPLTYAVFLARLRSVLSDIGFDPSHYSGHSFRRGGATFAFQCGVPGELIQSQGDWKSDAYKGYLDPSLSYRMHVMKTFANALQP